MSLKKIVYLFLITLNISSCQKERNKTVKVVRDCSGTYLQMDGKDYQVCNVEKTNSFLDGQTVIATFKKIDECTDKSKDKMVCYLLHPKEGWIEVSRIQ